jgi:hypothetical protein
VASVGTTLEAALAAGVNANAYDAPTSGTASALFHGRDTPGTSRIVIDEVRRVIVWSAPVEELWRAVAVFPSPSEVWLTLLEAREANRSGRTQGATAAASAHGAADC